MTNVIRQTTTSQTISFDGFSSWTCWINTNIIIAIQEFHLNRFDFDRHSPTQYRSTINKIFKQNYFLNNKQIQTTSSSNDSNRPYFSLFQLKIKQRSFVALITKYLIEKQFFDQMRLGVWAIVEWLNSDIWICCEMICFNWNNFIWSFQKRILKKWKRISSFRRSNKFFEDFRRTNISFNQFQLNKRRTLTKRNNLLLLFSCFVIFQGHDHLFIYLFEGVRERRIVSFESMRIEKERKRKEKSWWNEIVSFLIWIDDKNLFDILKENFDKESNSSLESIQSSSFLLKHSTISKKHFFF